MKNMKYVIGFIVVVVVIYYGYKYYKNRNVPKLKGTSVPNPADCGGGGERVSAECTKPKFIVNPGVKERCMEANPDFDFCFDKVVDNNGLGKTWYFNSQMGTKCCYVDSDKYPAAK